MIQSNYLMEKNEMVAWIQIVLECLVVIGIIFLAMFKKNYFPKYLEKKAENLASKEDIAGITQIVKNVELEYSTKFDEIQKKNDLFYSEIKNIKERFDTKQFELYNELWSALIDLKIAADQLWSLATPITFKDFANNLYEAKVRIEKSALLLENIHYEELISLIQSFENFHIGKHKLLSLRKTNQNDIPKHEIDNVIFQNSMYKNQYDQLIIKLKKEFISQIKFQENNQ